MNQIMCSENGKSPTNNALVTRSRSTSPSHHSSTSNIAADDDADNEETAVDTDEEGSIHSSQASNTSLRLLRRSQTSPITEVAAQPPTERSAVATKPKASANFNPADWILTDEEPQPAQTDLSWAAWFQREIKSTPTLLAACTAYLKTLNETHWFERVTTGAKISSHATWILQHIQTDTIDDFANFMDNQSAGSAGRWIDRALCQTIANQDAAATQKIILYLQKSQRINEIPQATKDRVTIFLDYAALVKKRQHDTQRAQLNTQEADLVAARNAMQQPSTTEIVRPSAQEPEPLTAAQGAMQQPSTTKTE